MVTTLWRMHDLCAARFWDRPGLFEAALDELESLGLELAAYRVLFCSEGSEA